VHLYDLSYRGCISCFTCKLKGGKSYGKCAVRDGLTPLLEKLAAADAFVLGSPIYFGNVTGEMRSFMERLLYQYLANTRQPSTLFTHKLRTAFVYTINVPESTLKATNYPALFKQNEDVLSRVFGQAGTLCSYETQQFEDYGKMVLEYFDPAQRVERRLKVFPEDCKRAYALGEKLAG